MKILNKIRWLITITSVGMLYAGNANAFPVINLDALKDGYSHTVKREFSAGTYEIIPVKDDYKAWTKWDLGKQGKVVCADPEGCVRTSSELVGWVNSYSFASPDLVNVLINGEAAIPVGDRYDVNQRLLFPDADSAFDHAWLARFTLTTDSIVSFMLPDSTLYDNEGGMSLYVVPEPSILALMALGLVGFGFTNRKKA